MIAIFLELKEKLLVVIIFDMVVDMWYSGAEKDMPTYTLHAPFFQFSLPLKSKPLFKTQHKTPF